MPVTVTGWVEWPVGVGSGHVRGNFDGNEVHTIIRDSPSVVTAEIFGVPSTPGVMASLDSDTVDFGLGSDVGGDVIAQGGKAAAVVWTRTGATAADRKVGVASWTLNNGTVTRDFMVEWTPVAAYIAARGGGYANIHEGFARVVIDPTDETIWVHYAYESTPGFAAIRHYDSAGVALGQWLVGPAEITALPDATALFAATARGVAFDGGFLLPVAAGDPGNDVGDTLVAVAGLAVVGPTGLLVWDQRLSITYVQSSAPLYGVGIAARHGGLGYPTLDWWTTGVDPAPNWELVVQRLSGVVVVDSDEIDGGALDTDTGSFYPIDDVFAGGAPFPDLRRFYAPSVATEVVSGRTTQETVHFTTAVDRYIYPDGNAAQAEAELLAALGASDWSETPYDDFEDALITLFYAGVPPPYDVPFTTGVEVERWVNTRWWEGESPLGSQVWRTTDTGATQLDLEEAVRADAWFGNQSSAIHRFTSVNANAAGWVWPGGSQPAAQIIAVTAITPAAVGFGPWRVGRVGWGTRGPWT